MTNDYEINADAEQSDLLQRMANALIEATPEWWNRATLVIERDDEGFGYAISNPNYMTDIVTPTDELYEATFMLQDLFEARRQIWQKAVLEVVKVGDVWQFTIEYEY